MNKSIYFFFVVVMMLSQFSVAQSAMVNESSVDFQTLAESVDISTSKKPIIFGKLESFEIVDAESNNMKVEASFSEVESFVLSISNTDGVTIYEEAFETDELNLAMGFSQLPDGDYFVNITTKDGQIAKPF